MRKSTQKVESDSPKFENNSQKTLFNLSQVEGKQVEVQFTLENTSSNGGLLLLKEVDNQIGLTERLSLCINDLRHQSYVKHSVESLIGQRVMQIAAGYEDANDCNELRHDDIMKLSAGSTRELASQPTMSRFENQPTKGEIYRMAKAFVDNFLVSYSAEPEVIIVDCDDTAALTYGQQQLTLFNNYYGDNCYMPLHIYEGLSGKLITTLLKPGRRSKSVNVFAILRRLITYLRQHWPKTIIILRGDSHFCSKEFMEWSASQNNVEFLTGLTGNSALNKLAQTTIKSAENQYESTKQPVKRYHSFPYKATTWGLHQRVIVKVEVTSMGTNVRYITTSMHQIRAKQLYENGYCARGSAELRIKNHKTYLHSDRMSCEDFLANQTRLFMHSAAYVLIHTLQSEILKATQYCTATMKTIQLKIIKIAARVKQFKTKIKIELPRDFPERALFENTLAMFAQLRI